MERRGGGFLFLFFCLFLFLFEIPSSGSLLGAVLSPKSRENVSETTLSRSLDPSFLLLATHFWTRMPNPPQMREAARLESPKNKKKIAVT